MHLDLTLFAGIAAIVVGAIAVWGNPDRAINRAFFTFSVHVALWLLALHYALALAPPAAPPAVGLFWKKIATAIGALTPLHLWFVKETIASPAPVGQLISKARWWIIAVVFLASLIFTEWFIPSRSSPEHRIFGWGYYVYVVGSAAVWLLLGRESWAQMRRQEGIRRLELQCLLIGACALAMAVIALMGLHALLKLRWLIGLQPPVVLLFYTATVVSITTRRVFDARQLLLLAFQKSVLIGVVALVAMVCDTLLDPYLHEPVSLFITTAISLWLASFLNDWLNRRFQFYPQAIKARRAVYDAAQVELRGENLEQAFLSILRGWGQSDLAFVAWGEKGPLHGATLEIPEHGQVVETMRRIQWVTPERLEREKTTSDRTELRKFLVENRLSVSVLVSGPQLTLLVGVGVPVSHRPFTYPQVMQLNELASIMEGALERVHLTAKAQRAEQLATVGLLGASFAHEIRNPLVSIKAFTQLLPKHYQDAAFRDKFFTLITEEVGRIDRLTEQLLDMASPRAYSARPLPLHPILRSALDLVEPKANEKNVRTLFEFKADPDLVNTDPSAATQVLLNLCFNAIQAVEGKEGERWIKVSTRNSDKGVEMIITDNGPGIAPEIRSRLFQPFQTTKSSGFGLGLAICGDILASLDATIGVDPSSPGQGATFRVIFPCPPS